MFMSFLKKYYLRTVWVSLLSYSHLRSIGKTGSRWDAFNLKLMSKCFNDLHVYTSLNLFDHLCNFHISQISHLLLGKQWDNFMSSVMVMKCSNSQEIEPRLLVTARFNKTRLCSVPASLQTVFQKTWSQIHCLSTADRWQWNSQSLCICWYRHLYLWEHVFWTDSILFYLGKHWQK